MSIHGVPAQRGGEPLRCPTCRTRLIEVDRAEVLIDACPECRGVWLERGELDKILVRERQLVGGADEADEDFFREVEGRPQQAPSPAAPSYGASAKSKPSEREAAELLARKAFDVYKGTKGKSSKKRKKGLLESLMDF